MLWDDTRSSALLIAVFSSTAALRDSSRVPSLSFPHEPGHIAGKKINKPELLLHPFGGKGPV